MALQPGATPSTIVVAPTSSVLIPTLAPTAPPTPTPPPGRGTSLEGLGFAVQLVDYELRPAEHPERAAVKYTLRFVNTSSRPVRTELNLADIRGIDNTGNIFGDYYAQANRVAETRCGIAANAPKYVENLTIQLPAQGVKQFDFFLTHVGAEGDCAEQGTARSRVDPITQFVDVQLGPIAYTSDTRRVLPSAWWRLTR
ncbi:MAG: hypothetical protein ACKVVP_00950 [Chloroflexota bacterium]